MAFTTHETPELDDLPDVIREDLRSAQRRYRPEDPAAGVVQVLTTGGPLIGYVMDMLPDVVTLLARDGEGDWHVRSSSIVAVREVDRHSDLID